MPPHNTHTHTHYCLLFIRSRLDEISWRGALKTGTWVGSYGSQKCRISTSWGDVVIYYYGALYEYSSAVPSSADNVSGARGRKALYLFFFLSLPKVYRFWWNLEYNSRNSLSLDRQTLFALEQKRETKICAWERTSLKRFRINFQNSLGWSCFWWQQDFLRGRHIGCFTQRLDETKKGLFGTPFLERIE
jgi:hypothetical protein